MDRICIEQLVAKCILGVLDWERKRPQKIVVDLKLDWDTKKPARTCKMEDTINYTQVAKEVLQHIQKSRPFLLETLAEEIASLCMDHFRAKGVMVKIAKPAAIRSAKAASVVIHRKK